MYRKLSKHFGNIKETNFPKKLWDKDFKEWVEPRWKTMRKELGFKTKSGWLIKSKPSVLFFEEDYAEKNSGLRAMKELIVDELGYNEN